VERLIDDESACNRLELAPIRRRRLSFKPDEPVAKAGSNAAAKAAAAKVEAGGPTPEPAKGAGPDDEPEANMAAAAAPVGALSPLQELRSPQANSPRLATVIHNEVVVKMKLIVVGCSSVGKTSLLKRYLEDAFAEGCPATAPTIGVANAQKDVVVDGEKLSLDIYDTAGQERFMAMTSQYYRKSRGIVLVYDVTDLTTFHRCARWMEEVRQHSPRNVAVLLLGNKHDLSQLRVVPSEMGQAFAKKHGATFCEVSAKLVGDASGVEAAFTQLCQQMINRYHDKTEASPKTPLVLGAKPSRAEQGAGCC
jgi:small GTP-binding protein